MICEARPSAPAAWPGARVCKSIIEVISFTPLLQLRRIVDRRGLTGQLFIKLEFLNPGLLKKDRIALATVEQAKRTGRLRDGQAVIEKTSRNAGTGFAIVCRAIGYPFIAVMSIGNTRQRAQMMRARSRSRSG